MMLNFQGKHIHCVGIGGAGVQALAEFLLRSGATVTGSDHVESDAIHRLKRLGAQVISRHSPTNLPVGTDYLVYSPAVQFENPERTVARDRGIRELSYPEALGLLMAERHGIAVAGTHGKSTTTAMIGWILDQAGQDPTVIVGARVPQFGGSSRVGAGSAFVAESCEFNRSFLNLHPQMSCVLNVEADHLDCYRDLDEIVASFRNFVELVPSDGLVVARGGDASVGRVISGVKARVETFSLEAGSTWWGADLRNERGRYRFRVFRDGDYVTTFSLQVPGKHNVENALAATAIAWSCGVRPSAIREALEDFRGCSRRFEFRGIWRGITVIDDYAHHPSEIRATLRAAREMFPTRRIWCVFQPHQLSRTRALFDDFAGSFADANHIIIADIYAAREPLSEAATKTALQLAGAISENGSEARHLADTGSIIGLLDTSLEPADILIVMGAGDIGKVADAFAQRLSRNRQAG
jgi:UDP-N-acetylmuramate--alanine ligase